MMADTSFVDIQNSPVKQIVNEAKDRALTLAADFLKNQGYLPSPDKTRDFRNYMVLHQAVPNTRPAENLSMSPRPPADSRVGIFYSKEQKKYACLMVTGNTVQLCNGREISEGGKPLVVFGAGQQVPLPTSRPEWERLQSRLMDIAVARGLVKSDEKLAILK
jgi:hypothetical protein